MMRSILACYPAARAAKRILRRLAAAATMGKILLGGLACVMVPAFGRPSGHPGSRVASS
jgi:hypothetical protein